MYINTGTELGQIPILHSFVAGMLGEDVDSKKIITDFLNQVRLQPLSFKKLLLTVALHPKPEASVIWEKQTFTFGKETRHLIDEILMSGLSTAFILTKLKQYSDASFSRQIKDEADLQIKMVSATQVLPKALLWPFLYDPLLLPMSGGELPYKELSGLARHFAQHMLPRDLAQQIMKSDVSEAHLAHLGSHLRSHAETLKKNDRHFKRQAAIARKWQQELEQRRKQRGTKTPPDSRMNQLGGRRCQRSRHQSVCRSLSKWEKISHVYAGGNSRTTSRPRKLLLVGAQRGVFF